MEVEAVQKKRRQSEMASIKVRRHGGHLEGNTSFIFYVC